MQALFGLIKEFAPYDISVLIQGETGTGKELVATAIHQERSPRVHFGPVNCAALPGEPLLSELFGHARGAFTGAQVRARGRVAGADGGTVFLDEVGELPPDAPARAPPLPAERRDSSRGIDGDQRVDVRIIAATHRDLDAAVESGTFREDLYHRLRKVVLRVPPLRARIEDLPRLVQHFLAQFNQRHGLSVRGVTRQALRLLERDPWPGNGRQLGDVLEPAAIGAKRDWITAEYLDLPVRRGADVHRATADAAGHALAAARAGLGWLSARRSASRPNVEKSDAKTSWRSAECPATLRGARSLVWPGSAPPPCRPRPGYAVCAAVILAHVSGRRGGVGASAGLWGNRVLGR